jgi:hypothetical protein
MSDEGYRDHQATHWRPSAKLEALATDAVRILHGLMPVKVKIN